MKFLLDTNAISALLAAQPDMVRRVRRYAPDDFGLPAIVAHEHYFGIFRSRRAAENLSRFDALQFEVLPFDREDARQAGAIRAELAAMGATIGAYDVLIAGQAKSRDLTLITHNTREFARVSGLRLEDWEE